MAHSREEDLKEARRLFDAGQHDDARRRLSDLADSGVPEAASLLGLMCFLGQGGPVDTFSARELLVAATKAGIGSAAHNLGTLYSVGGPGLPVDHEKARHYYAMARDLGVQAAPREFYR